MKKWFKNISYSFLGKIIAMLFLTLLDVVAARLLGVDIYAEWVFFFSIATMLFYIGWSGINNSSKIFISKCKSDTEKINTLAATSLLRSAFSIFISLLIAYIMPHFAIRLGYPDKYPNLLWFLRFVPLMVFFNSFTEYFKELYMGFNRFKELFILTVAEYCGYFIFSVAGLLICRDVRLIAVGYLISGIVVSIVGWYMLIRDHKDLFYLLNKYFTQKIWPVARYAVPLVLVCFGGLILVEMDTFMLGLMSTKEDVAVYSIAKSLCSKATHVNYSLTVGVMTSFAIIDKENIQQKKRDFFKAVKMNTLVTAAVAICFQLFADLAVMILYGNEYSRTAGLLRLLTIYYVLYAISNFFSVFLNFRGQAGFRSICYMTIVVINFTLNYLWIPRYGAAGAAMATNLSLVPYTGLVIWQSIREWRESI